jgi:hypothetical protein
MRICALGVEQFRHGGLEVGKNWTTVDVDTIDDRGRNTLRDYVGRFIQIHPSDIDQVAELGLALNEDGKLVEPPKKGDAAGKSDAKKKADDAKAPSATNTKTEAPKGDAAGKSDAKKEA